MVHTSVVFLQHKFDVFLLNQISNHHIQYKQSMQTTWVLTLVVAYTYHCQLLSSRRMVDLCLFLIRTHCECCSLVQRSLVSGLSEAMYTGNYSRHTVGMTINDCPGSSPRTPGLFLV